MNGRPTTGHPKIYGVIDAGQEDHRHPPLHWLSPGPTPGPVRPRSFQAVRPPQPVCGVQASAEACELRRAAPLDRTTTPTGTVPIDAQIRRYALAELVRRHRDELNDIYVMERYRRRLPTGKGEAAWVPASEIS